MRYRRGAALLAVGFVLVVAGQVWTVLDGSGEGANIGAGLVILLGLIVAVTGLIILALHRAGRRF